MSRRTLAAIPVPAFDALLNIATAAGELVLDARDRRGRKSVSGPMMANLERLLRAAAEDPIVGPWLDSPDELYVELLPAPSPVRRTN